MQLSATPPAQPALFDVPGPPVAVEPPTDPAARYIDREEQLPLWETSGSVHLPQIRSERTPDALEPGPENGNCGPAAATMALRLVGLDVPGFEGQDSQRVLDAARQMATGRLDQAEWASNEQLYYLLQRSGATVATTSVVEEALASVRQGKVLLALGNINADGWWSRSWQDPDTPEQEWGGHFVVVSGHRPGRDMYVLNDPGSEQPMYVSGAQLRSFMRQSEENGYGQLIVDGPGNHLRTAATEQASAGVEQLAAR